MAYYRNYETKDEILTKRLTKVVDGLIQKILTGVYTSRSEAIVDFFETFQSDNILQVIVTAGLADKLLDQHKRLMTVLYTHMLKLDLSDEDNLMRLYADMGSAVGMILYCISRANQVDSNTIAELLKAPPKIHGNRPLPQ